MMFVLIFGWRL